MALPSPLIRRHLPAALVLSLASLAHGQQYTTTRYVKVDGMANTAYIYDQNFVQLPNNPYRKESSVECFSTAEPRWFLGVDFEIVIRDTHTGVVTVVSSDPTFAELVHHFAMGYLGPEPGSDPCWTRPVGTGSELTDYFLPAGYGFQMQGGCLGGLMWHWHEHGDSVPHEEVYIRMELYWDDTPGAYLETDVYWVDARQCKAGFCVESGITTKIGRDNVMPVGGRLVLAIPHTHDHTIGMDLALNGASLWHLTPANDPLYAAPHDVKCGGGMPAHTHPPGESGHLPPGGLSTWAPGAAGPTFAAGDAFTPVAQYDNPHRRKVSGLSKRIDSMLIFITFFEKLD